MNRALLTGFAALWAVAAPAQVEIDWTLAHSRTVLMEPIHATVRIANHAGRDLDLTAHGDARLSFEVEDRPTSTVPGSGNPLLKQAVIVPAGETREVAVNLLDAYRILRGQTYALTPVVEFGGLRFRGARRSLEVQPGIELFRRDYGLPTSEDARAVSLRLINRDRGDRLFFRIDNPATGFCLGVYELGRVIRFFVPRLEQDRDGVFHVLHQDGPDRFAWSRYGYDGAPLGVRYYAAQVGRIRLVRGEDGAVAVLGGIPYAEDPEAPGMLTAPALPPSHPYNTTLAEPAGRGDKPAAPATPAPRKKPVLPAGSEKSDAGSEPVSW